MTLVRKLARPMVAALFVQGGIDMARDPKSRVEPAKPVVDKLAPLLHLPNDPELLVRVNGAAMAGAGVLFGLGKLPRVAALTMALTMAPTTVAGHPFWAEKDPAAKRQHRIQFLKNVSIIGGVLIAAVDTEGRPGVAWRSKHAVHDAGRSAGRAKKQAKLSAKQAKVAAKQARKGAALQGKGLVQSGKDALPG